jgi:cob(I)alamin adenosyltransferase
MSNYKQRTAREWIQIAERNIERLKENEDSTKTAISYIQAILNKLKELPPDKTVTLEEIK